MDLPLNLLRCIAEAVTPDRPALFRPPSEAARVHMARSLWQRWTDQHDPADLLAGLEALAGAPPTPLRECAVALAEELKAGRALADYLVALRAGARRYLRRPGDPAGRTRAEYLVPAGFTDLTGLLPLRLPFYHPGTCPVHGWELVELLTIEDHLEAWKAWAPHQPGAPVCALHFITDPDDAGRLRSAARHVERLQAIAHPGVLPLRALHLHGDHPCLEYDHLQAGNLASLIREWHARPDPPRQQASHLLRNLAAIVAALHSQSPPVVHGALCPAGIAVIRQPDGRLVPRITDLATSTLTGRLAPPPYATPQRIQGAAPSPRDDVYALGVIWSQLLTGDPHESQPDETMREQISAARGDAGEEVLDLLASCSNYEAAVLVRDRSRAELEDCEVSDVRGAGLAVADRAELQALRCQVHNAGRDGVHLSRHARATLQGCDLYENGGCGLAAETNSTPTVRDSRLTGNRQSALRLAGVAGGTVEGCDLRNNTSGAWASPPPDSVQRQNNQE
jgi:hypothetical protein